MPEHPRLTKVLLYLIWKDLTRHLKLLLMVAVALAFSLLGFFVSSSLLAGFEQTLTDSAINTAGHLIVRPPEGEQYIKNTEKTIIQIEEIPHVIATSKHLNLPLQVSASGKAVGTIGVGIVPTDEARISVVAQNISKGKFFGDENARGVVIGKFLADDLEGISEDGKLLEPGKKIKIITVGGRGREYEVIGVSDTKNVISNSLLYFPQKEARDLLSKKNETSEILIKLDSADYIENVREKIDDLNLPIRVYSWEEQAKYVKDLISAFSIVSNIINVISLLAAAMVMYVVISINTERKRKEIAILRSIGTRPNFIIKLFILEGFIYTVLAVIVGSPIYYLIHLRFQRDPLILIIGDLRTVINIELVTVSFGLFVVITLLAGFYPAWKAAKKTSIRLLWRE